MKILTSKLFRISVLLLIVGILVTQTNVLANILKPRSVYAVGDLTVTWEGQGTGDAVGPIFNLSDLAPGDSDSKDISVENESSQVRSIGIRGNATTPGILSDAMTIVISSGGTDLYGGTLGEKTLSQFFTDSQTLDGISLGTLNPGQTKTYNVEVYFLETAGNDFQNQSLVFNLVIGLSVQVPQACQNIQNLNVMNAIYGTQKSESIRGTNGNDLIFALEGSDTVDGRNGNDCIVGGLGSDALRGSNGNDVLEGNEGSDGMFGGNGNDFLYGGAGSDALRGENGNDTLVGDGGSDAATGGSGSDTCSAEARITCEVSL